ncbi:LamG domain-containing protein [Streptomyces sp. STR69]|uniref:LamG domain-containing protein n=1 Tax=Streptomyces sp. STR69 TaxID=1796942 RepID=UPI0021CAD34E|nr:LamG domain-containing protein [Streptomyces sp. STR69]
MALLVEMGWGGLIQYPDTITWTDISTRVDILKSGVAVTRGASDELSETQPGTATLRIDNSDGAFTPGNASSSYYPFVRRNAPIRISVAVMPTLTGSAPYPLAMLGDDFDDGRINTTLWSANFGTVSEVGGRARINAAAGVTSAFVSARQWRLSSSNTAVKLVTVPAGGTNARTSIMANSVTSGTRIGFEYNATTGLLSCKSDVGFADGAAVALTYAPIDHAWLRIRETSGTVYWETAPDGYDWTVRRTLATPAWVGTDQVTVQLSATRDAGTTDFAEYDLIGAEVRPRFYGTVNEFPIAWEGLASYATISCTDLFKRLNRLPTLRSMLAEEILSEDLTGVTDFIGAYYPLTEPSGSAAAGDLSGTGCGALAVTQVGAGGTLDFGADGLAETGDTSLTLTPSTATAGKYLTGDLGSAFAANTNSWAFNIEFWIKTTTVGRAILGLYEPSLDHQLVLALSASGELTVEDTDSGGSLVVHNSGTVLTDGNWHHVVYDTYGTAQVFIDGAPGPVIFTFTPQYALRNLHVGGYRSGRLFNGQIAHLAITFAGGDVGTQLMTHYSAGTAGYSGETADVRMQRLARYAGMPSVTVFGTIHDPIASQGPAGSTVVARMREVESTESGKLYAERDYFGLAYQSRSVRYNPSPASDVFTIAYADLETGQVGLADDDQKLVNDVEGSRPGGATQRVTAPSSVLAFGSYPKQLNILKTSDNSVLDASYWLVSRYANPSPELREVPIEAYTMSNYLDILDAEISDCFSVTALPSQSPASTLRVTVEGYTETIKEKSHVIQFHTSAALTDSVWVLNDTTYSVLDSTTRLAY